MSEIESKYTNNVNSYDNKLSNDMSNKINKLKDSNKELNDIQIKLSEANNKLNNIKYECKKINVDTIKHENDKLIADNNNLNDNYMQL